MNKAFRNSEGFSRDGQSHVHVASKPPLTFRLRNRFTFADRLWFGSVRGDSCDLFRSWGVIQISVCYPFFRYDW